MRSPQIAETSPTSNSHRRNPIAIHASFQVVRAFVRLREILATHKDLARKLQELEKRYDHQFKVVYETIRKLMTPPAAPPRRKIGFF